MASMCKICEFDCVDEHVIYDHGGFSFCSKCGAQLQQVSICRLALLSLLACNRKEKGFLSVTLGQSTLVKYLCPLQLEVGLESAC